jgi:hypothetical protein
MCGRADVRPSTPRFCSAKAAAPSSSDSWGVSPRQSSSRATGFHLRRTCLLCARFARSLSSPLQPASAAEGQSFDLPRLSRPATLLLASLLLASLSARARRARRSWSCRCCGGASSAGTDSTRCGFRSATCSLPPSSRSRRTGRCTRTWWVISLLRLRRRRSRTRTWPSTCERSERKKESPKIPSVLKLPFCGRSRQASGSSGGDPPKPPCGRLGCPCCSVARAARLPVLLGCPCCSVARAARLPVLLGCPCCSVARAARAKERCSSAAKTVSVPRVVGG